ncbi:MAG: carboxymuconolactone decarboxylase family protein [Neomegalonema sp.]|nr:carboxymuconolactone decarboxylase family protein [Neomegalonema sp.]
MAEPECGPLADEQWPEEIAELRGGFAGALNVYRVMAHHPALLRAWTALRQHIVKDSALDPETSELVILRAAHRMGSEYEWLHHVSRARAVGISDERIKALGAAPAGADKLIADGVDALFEARHLPAALEAALTARLGREGVFDLMATVGFYTTLGFLLMTYRPPLDQAIAAEMAQNPLYESAP